jgi:hypothetical protein
MTETKAAHRGGSSERPRAEGPAVTGEETTKGGGIALKLLAAARAVESVGRSGRNARFGYDYVTVDDVARAARTALLAEGLLVHSEITAIEEREIRSQNSSGLLIRLETRWRVLDAETGEASVPARPEPNSRSAVLRLIRADAELDDAGTRVVASCSPGGWGFPARSALYVWA